MKVLRLLLFALVAMSSSTWSSFSCAKAAAEDESSAKQKESQDEDTSTTKQAADAEPKKSESVRKVIPPMPELPNLVPKRRQPAKPSAPKQKAAANEQQPPADQQGQRPPPDRRAPDQRPPNRRERPPFWSPQYAQQYANLTPAMQLHLSRSGGRLNQRAFATQSAPAAAPGQGPRNFYPGVNRAPTQKPFADIEQPLTGLQRYWPLLLEGREDPNTGLIIWSFP